MVKKKKRALYNPSEFFDMLAADYDSMTEFNKRFKKEGLYFDLLVKRYNLKSALDVGCGTGFHSFLLSKFGLNVTAADISQNMLTMMREHARVLGLDVKIIHSSILGLKKAAFDKYDSVFCLGNTLANILTEKELYNSLKYFYKLLNPGGIIFMQILNYDRIMKTGAMIQSIREVGDKIFIRSYDYGKGNIRFNILKVERKKNGITHSLNSIMLKPWRAAEIIRILHQAKFMNVKVFGSIAMDTYNKKSSNDLVVLAQKHK